MVGLGIRRSLKPDHATQDIIADFVTGHIIYLDVIMWWMETDFSVSVLPTIVL